MSASALALRAAAPEAAPRRPTAGAVFGVATAVMVCVLFARNTYLFTTRIFEAGDQALNSALVEKAAHLDLLIGNYSRVGFHHPGPALLYLLAAGEALFRDVFPIVPTPFNGQLLGVFVAESVMVGLIVRAVYVAAESVPAAMVVLGAIVLYCGAQQMLAEMWFPFLYVAPFALLVVAAASVAAGRTGEIGAFVFAGFVLIHGHVSFIFFVGATTVFVVGCWLLAHRGGMRAELAAHRRAVSAALAIAAVFLLPMVIETASHWPDPWRQYWDYSVSGDGPKHHHSLSASWSFLAYYWTPNLAWEIAAIAAAAVGIALAVLDRGRRRFFGAFYAVAFLETALMLVYIAFGVDDLVDGNRYVGFFYRTVPMLIVAVAGAQLVGVAQEHRRRLGVIGLAGGLALFGCGVAAPKLTDGYRGSPELPAMTAAMQDAAGRAGRTVELNAPGYLWPQEAGIKIEADRTGLPLCVADPTMAKFFTADALCHGDADRMAVTVLDRASWDGRGAVLWSDATTVVLRGD